MIKFNKSLYKNNHLTKNQCSLPAGRRKSSLSSVRQPLQPIQDLCRVRGLLSEAPTGNRHEEGDTCAVGGGRFLSYVLLNLEFDIFGLHISFGL